MPKGNGTALHEHYRALSRVIAQPGSDTGEVINERSAPPSRTGPQSRRGVGMSPRRLAALVAALPLTLLLIRRVGDRAPSAATAPDSNLVAVAPFDVLSPNLALWREGLMDLLATQLEGAGSLHAVSPSAVMQEWRGRSDESSAGALGRR